MDFAFRCAVVFQADVIQEARERVGNLDHSSGFGHFGYC